MKKYFIIFIFFTNFSFAQNSLSGKITDGKDNTSLPGATIYITDLKTGAVSKEDGTYIINNLPNSTYLIEVRYVGYATQSKQITTNGAIIADFALEEASIDTREVVVSGNSIATDAQRSPQSITEVSDQYLNENSSTNVIDAISKVPGVSAMTDGQSISKPVIRGLGYNRVLTINDGVEQMDQAWFDEFGIEADPDAVNRVEILKGPASLAYGSDAIAGVVNLIPEQALPEGQKEGDILLNYQTNNGLINNMIHLAGTDKGISWSARVDNIMAHAYQNKNDGYVSNSQFSDFNADGTIGFHGKLGYTQFHLGYFDMATGIVDGTRDSATGKMLRPVAYPGVDGGNGVGQPFYVFPTNQELTSYTPFIINQRIRHTKTVWDNSLALGDGRITGIFSWQKNQREETNDPTMPNTPDIYYSSNAFTYDVRYIAPQMGGFNFSVGTNGTSQDSKSLGTLLLIPNYNFFQIGGFAIASEEIGNLTISGGLRYDTRTFTGIDLWVDSTQVPVPANTPGGVHEFQGFTSNFSGMSGSIGATYNFNKNIYVKGNIARGFRAPNVAECGANGVHDGTIVWELGDPNLKPETNLEEDFTFGINSKDITFEATGFQNDINDFIYAHGLLSAIPGAGDSINNTFANVGLGSAPVYQYTQAKAVLKGGEVVLDIHPAAAPWIELNASLSTVTGSITGAPDSEKVLPFVPPTRITADIEFHLKKVCNGIKNAYIKFGMLDCFQQNDIYKQYAIYNGLSSQQTPFEYAASQKATGGYTLFNAGIGGDIENNGHTLCKIYITANNLLNTTYMDYMNRFKYYPVNYANGKVGVFNMGSNFSFKVIIPFDLSKKA